MPNQDEKLTDLPELTSIVDGDYIYVVDVSDTTDDPTGSSKKSKFSSIKSYLKTYFDGIYANLSGATLTTATLSTGTKLDANADQNITQYGMARQAIMNGNFDVWQRGTSANVPDVSIVYVQDRFRDYADKNGGTLPTLTRSQQLLTSGDIQGAKYFTRLATNGAGTSLGASSFANFYQTIENGTSKLCGLNKKVTVSFWARSSISNKRICPALRQNYGTGGSPTSQEFILGTPITLTSSWVKYTATFTTNTLVGKTFGTNGDDYLELDNYYMWGTTIGNTQIQTSVTAETFVGSGNIDIAQVQLCSGDVALPFQPKSYEEELRACQRYCQQYTQITTTAYQGAGIAFISESANTVSMRSTVTPTIVTAPTYIANCSTFSVVGNQTKHYTAVVATGAGALSYGGAVYRLESEL